MLDLFKAGEGSELQKALKDTAWPCCSRGIHTCIPCLLVLPGHNVWFMSTRLGKAKLVIVAWREIEAPVLWYYCCGEFLSPIAPSLSCLYRVPIFISYSTKCVVVRQGMILAEQC